MTILQLLLLILLFKISYGKDLINIIYGKPMPNLADDRFATQAQLNVFYQAIRS
jgi:hypothetical protein